MPDLDLDLDFDQAWRLHPSVSVRPEEFGALLYDFRSRRLSFLTSRTLLDTVLALDGAASARDACDAEVRDPAERPAVERGLAALARSGMLARRPGPGEQPSDRRPFSEEVA